MPNQYELLSVLQSKIEKDKKEHRIKYKAIRMSSDVLECLRRQNKREVVKTDGSYYISNIRVEIDESLVNTINLISI